MKDTALKVSGVIFFLVAIIHLLRIILKVEVTVGGMAVPMGASVVGFIVPLLLALWMFKQVSPRHGGKPRS